jgi:Zn-dependent peptidase ImmA (M78 family)
MQYLICCHELGHDCLHRRYAQYDSLRDYTMFDCTGKIELQANFFAADLMIPDTDIILNTRWESNTYEHIAKMLYVPEALVKFKAYSISKRGYGIHTPELAKADFLKDI